MKKNLLNFNFTSLINFGKGLMLFCIISFTQQVLGQTSFNYSGSIVYYKVPSGVTSIRIEAYGAEGGNHTLSASRPGKGAAIKGTFNVTPGQRLKILVGQQPSASNGNGGGGGTYVTDTLDNPLIVAGGGSGSSNQSGGPTSKDGQITTSGGNGEGGGGNGGTSGSGGSAGASGFQSGAGGGFYSNGADGWTSGTGGASFLNGGAGGTNNSNANGGFGGGGTGSAYVVGGAGGGYSGGGSGGNNPSSHGGGGGSYNGGSNQDDTAGIRAGHGLVIITNVCSASSCSINVTPNSSVYTGGVNTNLYLGYGATSATLTPSDGGTMTWSPATYLSCSTCTSTVFTPTVAGNYTISGTNCFGTCTVTFCVKDIRVPNTSGSRAKVYLCHKEPVANRSQTLAVLNRGIAAHMQHHSGDMLGNCNNTCTSNKRDMEFLDLVVDENELEITCTPNPFRQSFKLDYFSTTDEEATVMIYGMTGNLVESVNLYGFTNEIELGNSLPNGIYTVSFLQGEKTHFFRMIKVN